MKSLLGEYRVKSRILIYKIKLFLSSEDLADKRFEPRLLANVLIESTAWKNLRSHGYEKWWWRNVRVDLDQNKLFLASGREIQADNIQEVFSWIKQTLPK